MNWKEYLPLAEKTLSTEFHCSKRDELILHGIMGILTEVEELMDNHEGNDLGPQGGRGEEVADIAWYLSIFGREYGIDFPYQEEFAVSKNSMDIVYKIIKNSLKVLDLMKKKLYYNKPIDDSVIKLQIHTIMVNICEYCQYYNIDVERSLETNIAKLKARYGDRFSSDRAINRNLDVEKKVLENGI